jgi:hypothetical protein
MTDGEKGMIRFGLSMAGFGLLGFIIPLVGLKFKKIAPENQYAAAAALLALGGLLSLGAVAKFSMRSRAQKANADLEWAVWVRRAAIACGVLFGLFIALCAGIGFWNRAQERARLEELRKPKVFDRGPFVGGAPAGVPAPINPNPNPGGPPANAPRPPVVLLLRNIRGVNLDDLRPRIEKLGGRIMAGGIRGKSLGDERSLFIHDIDSLDELVKKIDFGSATILDERSRRVAVVVDRTQFP